MSKRESTTCKQICEKTVQSNYITRNAKLQRVSVLPIFFNDIVLGRVDEIKEALSCRLLMESNSAPLK